jgi:S-adenosylmethionine hydrolase
MGSLVTFSSDYGPTDEFVGVCHLVIARIAPDARVLDVAHGISGVRAGSAVLAQSLPEAPEDAVHLAVVDPGVGTDRRGVAIACGNGSYLVGPDNGLCFPVADKLGGALAAYELVEPWFMSESPSRTFHGKDIFAPAAAHLMLGVSPHEFGPSIEPRDLVRLPPPVVRVEPGVLEAEVLRIDHFGNVQLAASGEDLRATSLSGSVSVNGVEATVGSTFADVASGALLVYVNSADHVAVACNRGSATRLLDDPAQVRIEPSVT